MNLGDALRDTLSREADMQTPTPPEVGVLIYGGRVRRRRRNVARVGVVAAAAVLVGGAAYGVTQIESGNRGTDPGIADQPSETSESAPTTSASVAPEDTKAAATTTGTVPTTTQRVYLTIDPWTACLTLDEMFIPLQVAGPGYTTTVEPTGDCRVHKRNGQGSYNTYVFDVPMPDSGKVTVTPGNQPAAELRAAMAARSNGATAMYSRSGFGIYVFDGFFPGNVWHA